MLRREGTGGFREVRRRKGDEGEVGGEKTHATIRRWVFIDSYQSIINTHHKYPS